MKDEFNGSAKRMWVHTNIQLVSFMVQGLFFDEVAKIYEQGNKAVIN